MEPTRLPAELSSHILQEETVKMMASDKNECAEPSEMRGLEPCQSTNAPESTKRTKDKVNRKRIESEKVDAEKLPDRFISCCMCFACTCQNCEYPGCLGCHFDRTTCCFETTSTCCKPVQDSTACCICCANSYEIVMPKVYHWEYSQCCCFEYYSVFPPEPKGITRPQNLSKLSRIADNFIPSGDVTVNTACLCCINSWNCQCPSCLGWYQKDVCLCCETESMGNKPLCCTPNKPNPYTLYVCSKGYVAIVEPVTLCKAINQFWCCDYRWACPCDEEVPCICGLVPYCTCIVDWALNMQCCATINEIVKREIPRAEVAYTDVTNCVTEKVSDSSRNRRHRGHEKKKDKKHRHQTSTGNNTRTCEPKSRRKHKRRQREDRRDEHDEITIECV